MCVGLLVAALTKKWYKRRKWTSREVREKSTAMSNYHPYPVPWVSTTPSLALQSLNEVSVMDETSPDGHTLLCSMAKTIHPLPPTQETSLSVFRLFPSWLLTPLPAGFQAVEAHVTLCLCQVFNKSPSSPLHGAYQASQLPPCSPGLPSSCPPQEPPTGLLASPHSNSPSLLPPGNSPRPSR